MLLGSIALACSCHGSDVNPSVRRNHWCRGGLYACLLGKSRNLGPGLSLSRQGLSDREIANRLNITELNAQGCVAWILHFLHFTDRNELIRYASVRAAI